MTRETEPIALGQTLVAPSGSTLTVLSVLFLGEGVLGIRRAQVRVRGTAGSELEFGAVIDRTLRVRDKTGDLAENYLTVTSAGYSAYKYSSSCTPAGF